MTRFARRVLVATAGALAWAGVAGGAGYGIYEQGSRALGMAGAFTAQAADPSAIFFNPAGLSQLEGTQVNLGVHGIVINREFAGTAPYPGYGVTEKSPTTVGTPINVYASHRFSPALAAGFGIYNPYGLKTEWQDKEEFSGRFISRESGLTPFYFTPAVAYSPVGGLSLAGGVTLIASKIHLERNVGQQNYYYGDARFPGAVQVFDLGMVEVDGSGTEIGWTAGARAELSEAVTAGAVYRSGADVEYKDGTADFTWQFDGSGNATLDAAFGPTLADRFPEDQKVSVTLPLPATAAVGLAFKPAPDWTVEVDGLWAGWSRLKTVGLDFEGDSLSSVIEENWKDAWGVRVGAEWRTSDRLALRAGGYWDQTPQPVAAIDPLLPDADRFGATLGAGFKIGPVHTDVYGLLLMIKDRSTEGLSTRGYDGTYASSALIGGLNLNYKF